MSDIKDISNSLESTIKDANLQAVTLDLAETFTDAIMEDGILKDIPIISTLIGLGKTGVNINEKLFLKKIITFISQLREIPAKKRNEMISKIDDSKKFKIKVGEKLLYIVNKCDDHEKSQLIGQLFKYFLQEKMDYDCFIRCTIVIDKAVPNDLMRFVKGDWKELNIEESAEYLNWGVFHIKPLSVKIKKSYDRSVIGDSEKIYEIQGGQLKTEINEIGIKLREALQ